LRCFRYLLLIDDTTISEDLLASDNMQLGKLDSYEDEDWRHAIEKGRHVTGLVMSLDDKSAAIKMGPFRAVLLPADSGRCRSVFRAHADHYSGMIPIS